MWDDIYKMMQGWGASSPAAPAPVDFSTPAPQGWTDQMAAQPGFNLLGSGGGMPSPGVMSSDPSFMQGLTGYTDTTGNKVNGWGGMALGAAQGLGSAFMGMKQFQLAQDTLKENKRQFEMNYGAQKQLTNSMMEDRQRARVASNAGAYESVDSYMNKNRVR